MVTRRAVASAKALITTLANAQMLLSRQPLEEVVGHISGGLAVEACVEVAQDTSDKRKTESRMSFYWQKMS